MTTKEYIKTKLEPVNRYSYRTGPSNFLSKTAYLLYEDTDIGYISGFRPWVSANADALIQQLNMAFMAGRTEYKVSRLYPEREQEPAIPNVTSLEKPYKLHNGKVHYKDTAMFDALDLAEGEERYLHWLNTAYGEGVIFESLQAPETELDTYLDQERVSPEVRSQLALAILRKSSPSKKDTPIVPTPPQQLEWNKLLQKFPQLAQRYPVPSEIVKVPEL